MSLPSKTNMEGDVTYAALQFPLSEGGRRDAQAEQTPADTKKEQSPENSAVPRSSLWVGSTVLLGILCLLLLSACIALGILVLQSEKNAKPSEAEAREGAAKQTQESEQLKELEDRLNQRQAALDQMAADLKNTTEEFQRWRSQAGPCLHCPKGWALRNTTCYYQSTEKQDWPSSLEDCVTRGAHLVTTYDNTWEFFKETPHWVGAVYQYSYNVWVVPKNIRSVESDSSKFFVLINGVWYRCGAKKDPKAHTPSLYGCGEKLRWVCERAAALQPLQEDSEHPTQTSHGGK